MKVKEFVEKKADKAHVDIENWNVERWLEAMEEYAKQKWYEACEKQRQFCAQACYGEITDEQWDSIENAPSPEYK